MHAIYGLYPDPESAERGLKRLRAQAAGWGIAGRDLCVSASEPLEAFDLGWREEKTAMPWIAAAGGGAGAALAYLVVSVTQRAYVLRTGNMPIVSLWPTGVIMFELTMLGAIITTLITLLISARLPNLGQKIYDPAVSEGKVLIGVRNPKASVCAELLLLLRDTGAEEVRELGFHAA